MTLLGMREFYQVIAQIRSETKYHIEHYCECR
jgi:hypothetical protein